MGNAGSAGGRDRQKGDLHSRSSPVKDDNQIYIYHHKKRESELVYQSSNDDEEPNFTKDIKRSDDDVTDHMIQRQRLDIKLPLNKTNEKHAYPTASATITEGSQVTEAVFPTVFKWDGGGKQVLISGTFSDWKAIPMVKSHGDFVTIIDLTEGEHQFKYCVDGEWMHDPTHKVVDGSEGKTNMIAVKNQDFEVFQALAADSEITSANQQPIGDYSQVIPPSNPWEKTAGPPILPPHLLQVILNKDTPISCEPTLLPEPNHVMLNHMYALSIKDGVMVLSATHRYKKKYVTTLLYKPI